MSFTFWDVMFYVAAVLSLPPFVVMYVAWIALRLKKMSLARWRRYQRLWFYLGITLMGMGALFHLFGTEEAKPAAFTALLGGVLNTVVALFQGRIVELLTKPPR